MSPPTIHMPKNQKVSGTLAATTEGVRKIPAPITRPMISTNASIKRRAGLGVSAEEVEVSGKCFVSGKVVLGVREGLSFILQVFSSVFTLTCPGGTRRMALHGQPLAMPMNVVEKTKDINNRAIYPGIFRLFNFFIQLFKKQASSITGERSQTSGRYSKQLSERFL